LVYTDKLTALATLAATGASFAQSAVTITGSVDAGFKAVSNDTNATAKWSGVGSNNITTSNITFKGTEDLGGGMKAGFLYEIDPGVDRNTTLNQQLSGTAPLAQTYTGASAVNGEAFVQLAGAFGDIKAGTPNSPALIAGVTSQPFGTALGGGYSAGFGRLGTAAISGINQYVGGPSSGGRIIRHEKAAVYTTPTFSGFNAQIEYSGKNSNGGFASNDNGLTTLALNYNNGPLNAIFTNTKASGGNAAGNASAYYALPYSIGQSPITNTGACTALTANTATTSGCVAPAYVSTVAGNALKNGESVTYNIFGANYAVDQNTTVYFGYTTTKGTQTASAAVAATSTTNITPAYAPENSKSWNLAGKYTIGQFDLLANYLERKSALSAADAFANATTTVPTADYNPKQTLVGLGVNYNLSKLTTVYVRYEQISGLNAAAAAAVTATTTPAVAAYGNGKLTTSAVGIKVAF